MSHPPAVGAPEGIELLYARIAALEQLLEVHEQTSLEQATRLEQALEARDRLLSSERTARAALVESEQRLLLALDAGRMGSWEWDIEAKRVIWSASQERLFGLEPGTFSGSMEEYRDRIHPEDREHSLALVREALAGRAPTHDVVHRIVRPDGEIRWLESHARFVYAEDGRPLRLVGVSKDVTEARILQRAVEHERKRLQQVLMEAPAAIAVTEGPEHVIVTQNAVSRQLVGGRDLVGLRMRDAVPEVEAQGLIALQDEVYQSGKPFVGREVHVRFDRNADGKLEEGYFNFVYQPLTDADSRVYGILTHAVEVTDQVLARHEVEHKAEELARLTTELERSNRDLDQFAYVASHDLKAPLRGIANLAQWIEEDLGDRVTGESREHMRLLKGRVHRMEALIEGILAYSRAGRVREKLESVDVAKLLAESIELLAPPPGSEVIIGSDMPTLVTERVPLQQVFLNLIGNAIKYADRPDLRVRVTSQRQGRYYQFSIADNGPGIAPQYRDKIWQIFQTLAPRDRVEGTGIGLSVVRKIVDSRGGQTWVDSEPGHGATFHFTWPAEQETT